MNYAESKDLEVEMWTVLKGGQLRLYLRFVDGREEEPRHTCYDRTEILRIWLGMCGLPKEIADCPEERRVFASELDLAVLGLCGVQTIYPRDDADDRTHF